MDTRILNKISSQSLIVAISVVVLSVDLTDAVILLFFLEIFLRIVIYREFIGQSNKLTYDVHYIRTRANMTQASLTSQS